MGCGVAVYKVGAIREGRSAGGRGEIQGDALGVETEGLKWNDGRDFRIQLCQPPFRGRPQSDDPHQENKLSSQKHKEMEKEFWMNRGRRRLAISHWRGMRSPPGVRNPKVAKPGENHHHLGSSPCPYPSGSPKMFHWNFERRYEEESECMLRRDLRASVGGDRQKWMPKRTTKAIRRASLTHC